MTDGAIDYEAAWRIAEQRTRDAQAQTDLVADENRRLVDLLMLTGRALETLLLEWDGSIADPKLADAYRALKAYRESPT